MRARCPTPRFAPLDDRGTGLGASALKHGIEQLVHDPEVQAQVARETGNEDLLEDYQQQRAEQISREFMRCNPTYHRCPENWEMLVHTLAYNALGWNEDEADASEAQDELIRRGFWTLDNLTATFNALSEAGVLEVAPDPPRHLTERALRAIALQAKFWGC